MRCLNDQGALFDNFQQLVDAVKVLHAEAPARTRVRFACARDRLCYVSHYLAHTHLQEVATFFASQRSLLKSNEPIGGSLPSVVPRSSFTAIHVCVIADAEAHRLFVESGAGPSTLVLLQNLQKQGLQSVVRLLNLNPFLVRKIV